MSRRHQAISAVLFAALGFSLPSFGQALVTASRTVNLPTVLDDDATLLEPGSYTLDEYTSYSHSPQDYYASVPGLSFTVGLDRYLEFSVSSGFRSAKGETYGLDDNLVGMKVLLLSPHTKLPAIAIKPTLEVLSAIPGDPQANSYRADFGLPVLVEKDFDSWSTSYTAGYLTRGVVFGVFKLEGDWWGSFTPMAMVSYSQMTTNAADLQSLGVNRRQTDAQGGFTWQVNSAWSVFAQSGRTIGPSDLNNYSFEFTGGVTLAGHWWDRSNVALPKQPAIHF